MGDASKIEFPEIADGEDKSSAFKNCLRNNYRHLRKWAKRTRTNAFRLYDREVKGYPVAIDFYANRFCVHFFSKHAEDPSPKLQNIVAETLFALFKTDPQQIFWKTRKRQAPSEQYEKLGRSRDFFTVFEYGLQFQVNLRDYLDTGLFLDHRETRHMVGEMSKGKKVLNLFAYTCAFSVHAAAGGALYTKSVDISNTYTTWARENFQLNALSLKNNALVCADCLKFLDQETAKYDLIIIDPPTLSRSKKMERSFNVQLDYVTLINKSLQLLSEQGTILFSTNSRTFKFDKTLFENCSVKEIKTIPLDFRNEKIHKCWIISYNQLN